MAELLGPNAGRVSLITTSFPLDDVGYRQEEYVLAGQATAYEPAGSADADGRWSVRESRSAPFRTRIVVYRPSDPDRFTGTVLVEWLNVSSGADVAAEWLTTHRHLVREGFAWVGVSAQREGVDGQGTFSLARNGTGADSGWSPMLPPLKQTDPDRYGELDHPGDPFAFDVFTSAGRAVRDGLFPGARVLAAGASQSASYLVTYVNAVAPRSGVFDGYLIHGRPGNPASLTGWDGVRSGAVRIRTDGPAPVLVLQTETDVVGVLQSAGSRQPDADRFRLWEIAGAAHADTYTIRAAFGDSGALGAAELAALLAPTRNPFGPEFAAPINSGPQHHYVAQAAVAALDRWVRSGTAPAVAPRLTLRAADSDGADRAHPLELDAAGLARGGVRTPWVDVPTAVLSGLGQEASGGGAVLFGSTWPFAADVLAARYPGGHDEYLAAFARSTREAIDRGFLLAEDEDEIVAVAAASYPGDRAGGGAARA
ncbi:alpha/beta hydrolase domain-containing protein [Cryptosporangium minutisporangium]|uniref:Alpha/beta hydrolase domain-containing protein n=1 Tax=Cryptosporangium minutisporangium TaxID=113569 RepID=A0ABP6T9M7_9ACTN